MTVDVAFVSSSVNGTNHSGYTPLHTAANCGYTLMVQMLLAAGAR
jgi:ankyrin repeat protein